MSKNKDFLSLKQKEYFSTADLAKLLGVSRVAIFKKIKSGKIKAEKVGKSYVIPRKEFEVVLGMFISNEQKKKIDESVKKAVKEYAETFRLLGKE
jgi:excisionase family DNA binding protein